MLLCIYARSFPGGTVIKKSACQFRRRKRHRLDPWVGKTPWSKKWQPTSVFLPEKFRGQMSLAGSWDYKELVATEHACNQSILTKLQKTKLNK